MPVAYATNDKASEDYIIMVYGSLPHADELDESTPYNDPVYKDAMDSVLQSILKRLPLGPMADQYRIVCNVEARAGQEDDDDEMALVGYYRVRIFL